MTTDGSFEVVSDNRMGQRCLLVGEWSEQIERRLRSLPALELNQSRGGVFADLEMLARVPWLKSLFVIHLGLRSSAGLRHISEDLEWLTLSTYDRDPVDFLRWPSLRDCGLEWRQGSESVFDSKSIETLHINRGHIRGLSEAAAMTSLTALRLTGAYRLESLAVSLPRLRSLNIGLAPRLHTLIGIDGVGETLTELVISTARKVTDLGPLTALKRLRRLVLSDLGGIDSLEPIREHPSLEEVRLIGTTNVADGRVSILRTLPRLKRSFFVERRHYDMKMVALDGG